MTEADYISELRSRWPHKHSDDVSLETIALADEAVRAFPLSARLSVMRGNLIQLGPTDCPYSLDDALACYQKAIEIDPEFAEGWEDIGHFHHAVLDDEAAARRYFLEAERLRGQNAA
jgi:tetratricopeptide (TPR) repeat protein